MSIVYVFEADNRSVYKCEAVVYGFEADNRSVYKCLLYMDLKQTIGQYTSVCCICI